MRRIWPHLVTACPSKNLQIVDFQIWMGFLPCLHRGTLLHQQKGELLYCILNHQALPIRHLHCHQCLVKSVGVHHHHVDQLKNNFWQPIMRPTLPPHVVRCLGAVPLVDEVKCPAIVFHLRRTWHLHQLPLPLPIAALSLPTHAIPRRQDLRPVTIWQHLDNAVVTLRRKHKRFVVVLPPCRLVCPHLHLLCRCLCVWRSQPVALHRANHVHPPNISAYLGHDVAHLDRVHCHVLPLTLVLVNHHRH